MSVDYPKLRTNLNLIMHRLKLVEKKKMELNQKARRTIGEFLNAGKVDRARIRVEQIIREDYVVEAMDLIESYCDFLVSRFGQLQASEVVDDGLATPVSSIIWATPRLETDVPELKVICDQLGRKYGKQYVQAVRENQLKTVNEVLIKKMGMEVPNKVLVEKYLVEIAKDQKIDYKPDPRVMKENEADTSVTSDDDSLRQQSTQAPRSGFNLIDLGDHYPRNPITQPFNAYGQPPPLPSEPPQGRDDTSSPLDGSGGLSIFDTTDATAPSDNIPIGFNLNQLSNTSGANSNPTSSISSDKSQSRKVDKLSSASNQANRENVANPSSSEAPPPNYDSVVNKQTPNQTQYYSFGPDSSFASHRSTQEDLNDTLPELPPVPQDTTEASNTRAGDGSNPSSATAQESNDALDFDDLTRRFEELKNKKN